MQDRHIARLKQQDRQVVGELYDAYGAALYGVILRIVQSPELAQQALQDTFLKVWRNAAAYDESKGRLFTWLLNIARNTAIDATRTAHFRHARMRQSLEHLQHSASEYTVKPEHIGVRDAVNHLDEKYRILIEMVYFREYTQEEAAKETGVPLGTVKTRIRFALNELRKIFSETPAGTLLPT